ncbi:cysteine-rich CWC family protein [Paenibacillus sp. 1P07SE]|uniref:cysteine-rich CWC family protein n=1 Tax=Paenibacillus sp. 1P07SE TaxID=3132209 RepID=UPI0039A5E5CD
MTKPQLVLDVAGVLLTNLSPGLWKAAAGAAGISGADVQARFRAEAREALWHGRMSEEEFWHWFTGVLPGIDPALLQTALKANLQPLPALGEVARWSRTADVHLLTNHRHEWLEEPLSAIGDTIASLTVSSQAGVCKPDPRIYDRVQSKLPSAALVIFVDDQDCNLAPARALGWRTVLADPAARWIAEVDRLLQTAAEARCPLCGGDNRCGVLRGTAIEDCWCYRTAVPRELREQVPEELAGKACICEACVARHRASRD